MKLFADIAAKLAAAAIALGLMAAPALATQATIVMPSVGPHSMSDLDQNWFNPAFASLLGMNSGASAPANGPGGAPLPYQLWANTTTTTPASLEIYDGAQWVSWAQLNSSTHTIGFFGSGLTADLNASSLASALTGTMIRAANADGVASRYTAEAFAASGYFTGLRADGTNASKSALVANDEIGGFNAWGWNGTAYVGPAGALRVFAAGTWTSSSTPTYVDIATTASGSTTEGPALRAYGDAGVYIGSTPSDPGANNLAIQGGANIGGPVVMNSNIVGASTSGGYTVAGNPNGTLLSGAYIQLYGSANANAGELVLGAGGNVEATFLGNGNATIGQSGATLNLVASTLQLNGSTAATTINSQSCNLGGSCTITAAAAANALTGTTLASGVVNSSLTNFGTVTQFTLTAPNGLSGPSMNMTGGTATSYTQPEFNFASSAAYGSFGDGFFHIALALVGGKADTSNTSGGTQFLTVAYLGEAGGTGGNAFMVAEQDLMDPVAGAQFTGSISGTTLSVTRSTIVGSVAVGQVLTGSGVTGGTTIASVGTCTYHATGTGTCTVNNSQTVGSETLVTSPPYNTGGLIFAGNPEVSIGPGMAVQEATILEADLTTQSTPSNNRDGFRVFDLNSLPGTFGAAGDTGITLANAGGIGWKNLLNFGDNSAGSGDPLVAGGNGVHFEATAVNYSSLFDAHMLTGTPTGANIWLPAYSVATFEECYGSTCNGGGIVSNTTSNGGQLVFNNNSISFNWASQVFNVSDTGAVTVGIWNGTGIGTSYGGLYNATNNAIPYGQTGAIQAFVSPVNNAVLATNGSGVPSEVTTLPSGLTANTIFNIINSAAASSITADGANIVVQNSSTTADSIYNATGASGSSPQGIYDVIRGTLNLASGSTLITNDVFGATLTDNVVFGGGQGIAATGYFFQGIANVAGAHIWGAALALNDNVSGNCNSATTYCLLDGIELDFTTQNSTANATHIQGVSLILNAVHGATTGNGVQVTSKNSNAQFSNAFVSNDGAAAIGMVLGATAISGTSIFSQGIQFNSFDSGGSEHSTSLNVDASSNLNWPTHIVLGANGGNNGAVVLNGSTSGSVSLVGPSSGSGVTATLPGNTGTVAELNLAQTWTATQTFAAIAASGTNNIGASGSPFGEVFATGHACRSGTGGSFSGNNCNVYWDGNNPHFYIDTVDEGPVPITWAVTTATTPASFSANRRLQITINGTTYYIGADTATW